MGQIIECSFNLFKEGRQYTGHHRQYVLESALKTCNAPETREKIKLREALGYLGHGRRFQRHHRERPVKRHGIVCRGQ